MKKILLLGLIVLITVLAQAQKPALRIPYTLSDDFETGELFAWETYPYQQDDGYDPLFYTLKTPTHNNSKYAISRAVRANETAELYHGFTKQINLWTVAGSRLKMSVYFQGDRNPSKLELSLGTFDGKRYMYNVANLQANKWIEIDVPVSDFKRNGESLTAGEHLQVVTVKGSYDVVYYMNTYTILMDDFSISGERDAQFTASTPKSTFFENFNVSTLNKHFFYGDNIALSVNAEGNATLNQVLGTLVDGNGKVVKDKIPFTKEGSEWSNNSIYALTEKDARGQWEIRLTGTTPQGGEVRWALRFLMPGNKVNSYPRLFFSNDELKNRMANEKSPVAKRILEKAIQNNNFRNVDLDAIQEGTDVTGDALTGGPYSPGGAQSAGWNSRMTALGQVIREGSFRYAFTGDATAGEKAKKALLKLCSFSKWNAQFMINHQYWTYWQVGDILKNTGYGYDMLHDLMTPDERKYVRDAIMEKGLKFFHRDMVEMNRMPSNNTNHIAMLVTGYGLAAIAIYGEDPQNPYLEPYLSGIITKTKAFLDKTYYEDGSYGEPKSDYMDMASRAVIELIISLEKNFGIDYTTTTNIKNFYKYPLQSMSKGRMQDYGDGGGPNGEAYSFGNQLHAQWLVYKLGNPILYNYVKPYWEAGNGGYFGYLFYKDANITPVLRETMPTSAVFSAQGIVMRSGWDDASSVILTRVGPNSNHYHYDQGSFQIMTNGETLLTDPGRGDGGYYDLDYQAYNIQAIAHNVMLVDHDPESQTPADYDNGVAALRDWPRMTTAFAGKNADAMEADLTTVYKNKLDSYTRTMLYTKNGPLFLFDQVKSKTPHVYDWMFHAAQNAGNKRSLTYTQPRMLIEHTASRLNMDIIAPEIAANRIRDKNEDMETSIMLSSKPDLKETNFFAVILPEAKPAAGDYPSLPVTTRVDAKGWLGAKVQHSGLTDYGFFRTADAADEAAGFKTDATRFTASYTTDASLSKVYFEGTSFSGNRLAIKSTIPVICSYALTGKQQELEISAEKAGSVTVLVSNPVSSVSLKGQPVKNWKYESKTKTITLQIAAGKNDYTIQ